MRLITNVIALPLATAMAMGILSPAFAGRVRYVSATAAEEGSVSISVHIEGGGVLLDFSATGEQIKQISIDDASRVVVDHCLVSRSCDAQPSPIIRLFRSKGVKQQDIPMAKTTLLSVQTVDTQGQYHSYPFPITTPNNGSSVSKIVIGGASEEDSLRRGALTRNPIDPSTIALGAREAETKSLLVDPQLKARIQNYLQLLQSGLSSRKAAENAGISQDLVARLEQLGQGKAVVAKARKQVPAQPSIPKSPIIACSSPAPPPPTPQIVLKQQVPAQPSNPKSPIVAHPSPPPPQQPTPQIVSKKVDIGKIASTRPTLPKLQMAPTNPNYKPNENHLKANALVRGLSIAKHQKKISTTIAARVQDVIYNLRKGEAISVAAKRSGVPMQTIDQLLVLSQSGG